MLEESIGMQYTFAFYWALQTLTTVGFGDTTIITVFERVFAIAWMIIGVAFYSYAIGAMTNYIEALDRDKEELNHKLSVLKEYRVNQSMPMYMY